MPFEIRASPLFFFSLFFNIRKCAVIIISKLNLKISFNGATDLSLVLILEVSIPYCNRINDNILEAIGIIVVAVTISFCCICFRVSLLCWY